MDRTSFTWYGLQYVIVKEPCLVGHSDRRHGKQVPTFSRHARTLVGLVTHAIAITNR